MGTILKQIYPPNMMRDLETSSQEAIIELAQAFPYQPSAGSAGLSRFQQVRHHAVLDGLYDLHVHHKACCSIESSRLHISHAVPCFFVIQQTTVTCRYCLIRE